MRALFLICALALPAETGIDRLAPLHAFLKMNKNYEIYLAIDDEVPEGKGWERASFKWENYRLWIKQSV